MKHKDQKTVKQKLKLESSYYYKCGRILKSFTSSKSERRMYNALKKLNEASKEYIEKLAENKLEIGRLPKWENIIIPA